MRLHNVPLLLFVLAMCAFLKSWVLGQAWFTDNDMGYLYERSLSSLVLIAAAVYKNGAPVADC